MSKKLVGPINRLLCYQWDMFLSLCISVYLNINFTIQITRKLTYVVRLQEYWTKTQYQLLQQTLYFELNKLQFSIENIEGIQIPTSAYFRRENVIKWWRNLSRSISIFTLKCKL